MPSVTFRWFGPLFRNGGRVVLRTVLGVVLLAALRSEGALDSVAGHWAAVDGLPRYTTGDIDVSSTGITAQNGTTIQLKYVRDRADLGTSAKLTGSEFRIVNPDRLVLLGGSGLCGPVKETYLVLYKTELTPFELLRNGLPPDAKYQGLSVDVYRSSQEPKPFPDGFCTGVLYVRPDPDAAQSNSVRNSSLAPMLKGLRWGMPEDEVNRLLPNFVSTVAVDVPDLLVPANPAVQSTSGTTSVIKRYYRYQGCVFVLTLSFIQGRLGGIDLVGLSAAACEADIAKEINETFAARPGNAPPAGNRALTIDRLGNEATSVMFSLTVRGVILFLSPVSRNEITEGRSPVE